MRPLIVEVPSPLGLRPTGVERAPEVLRAAGLRLFGRRAFAIGNATTFFMSGAIFAGAYLVAEEFQFARHYSPVSTGLRLLPFFAMPMIISPLAGPCPTGPAGGP